MSSIIQLKNMRSNVFGVCKIIFGAIFIGFGIYFFFEKLDQKPRDLISLISFIMACAYFVSYGSYLAYSGLTQVKKLKLKKGLWIVGLILSLMVILNSLFILIGGNSNSSIIISLIGIATVLIIINDTLRIRRQNRSA